MNKKVSVLIVTYNSGKYINNTVQSVIQQSYKNLEILILDNNSSDNTVKNIKKIAEEDSRIEVFESSINLGPYGGLNYLLEKSSGEYIAIQDHDDLWHTEKLDIQIDFLDKNKSFIGSGTEAIMYYENDKTFFIYHLEEYNYYTVHPSLVFRKTENFRYDETLVYFGDAYSQKNNLCNGEKNIYNIKKPLTLHIIKGGYSNYTYSWFRLDGKHIKRIFDVHGFGFYSIFVLLYEIFRKGLLGFLRVCKSEKIFIFFDRLPYKLSGNKIMKITNIDNRYIREMRDMYL